MKKVMADLTGLILSVSLFSVPAIAATSGEPRIQGDLKQVPRAPYDETADPHLQVEAAIARAEAAHKLVLLDFGGNWCPDCRVTAGVLELSEVKPWVEQTFETVMIDVGRMNKNLDIAGKYGVKIRAVPTIIVLDPQSRMVNSGNPDALKDARGMTPQAIVDTIYGWTQKPA